MGSELLATGSILAAFFAGKEAADQALAAVNAA